jgi:hypothetical protein
VLADQQICASIGRYSASLWNACAANLCCSSPIDPHRTPTVFPDFFHRTASITRRAVQARRRHRVAVSKQTVVPLVAGALVDLLRTEPALVLENALLRQQRIILQRELNGRATPSLTARSWRCWPAASERGTIVSASCSLIPSCAGIKSCSVASGAESHTPAHQPPLAPETIALIRELAAANRTEATERIRRELLKLNIRVAKSTIKSLFIVSSV